ncbi:uncharacterized protein LOC136081261 [Hydra vulgaris]|uniref:Uncharacterized protein LOC136081261 n=1 Tax=Hydra vulgaris TaxID=6087 RepID=A0ABM4BZG2_HYDVU
MHEEFACVKEGLNEQKQEITKSMHSAHTNDCKAKLSRLQISKFDGTILDWVRFWEQFSTEIDSTSYPPVTKLSYLRELLSNTPKKEISGLPFNANGYEKAKIILNQKYGINSEIIRQHGRDIMDLPYIKNTDADQIHNFYRKLNVSINSLKNLNKLETAEILVRETLDKLGPVKADITRTDPKWLEQLIEALREYTLRNPESSIGRPRNNIRKKNLRLHNNWEHKNQMEKHFQHNETRNIGCIYCSSQNHCSYECTKRHSTQQWKQYLKENHRCFNCMSTNHTASNCCSKRSCYHCQGRHPSSICTGVNKDESKKGIPMTGYEGQTIHPTVVVNVDKYKVRALLDTGAGSSYASSTLIKYLKLEPNNWESKNIETMTGSVHQNLPLFYTTLYSIKGCNSLDIKLYKKFKHLERLHFHNEDDYDDHKIHLIIGAGDIARIKLKGFRTGNDGEAIAEETIFGWTVMEPGKSTSDCLYFTKPTNDCYKELYSLDVLGLEDRSEGNQNEVYEEFKEQLQQDSTGFYHTGLPWKEECSKLVSYSDGCISRLHSLLRKLEKKPNDLIKYNAIIQEQLKDGIIEYAPNKPTGKRMFYMPHRAVIKEDSETTKLRIVFDASAKEYGSPSFNDCLHIGPPLQPLLLNVILQNRFHPACLTGDIKQAFLQIRVDNKDRDVFRFY